MSKYFCTKKDDPEVFQKLIDHTLDFSCEDIVFGGDFNAVLDLKTDKRGGNPTTYSKSVQKINEIAANLHLTDIWRETHPDEYRFTWQQRRTLQIGFFSNKPGIVLSRNASRYYSWI